MKVYIVMAIDAGEKNILSVHKSSEGAEKARNVMEVTEWGEWYDIKVVEFNLLN
jgi:hypothetical protein